MYLNQSCVSKDKNKNKIKIMNDYCQSYPLQSNKINLPLNNETLI